MILTFSSLLLQAPSLCSEKLSDEPLRAQKCSPRHSRGCPRSSPKHSSDALGALSGVSRATWALQKSPSEPLDCSKPPSQAAQSLSELLWTEFGLLSKLLAPLKPKLRNSLILTFSCSCSSFRRSLEIENADRSSSSSKAGRVHFTFGSTKLVIMGDGQQVNR